MHASSGMFRAHLFLVFFFFNDTATTEIYTLSLHDALPISVWCGGTCRTRAQGHTRGTSRSAGRDRKSTRLNSSHDQISYAVFCLKKKKKRKVYTVSVPWSPRKVTEAGSRLVSIEAFIDAR